MALLDLPRELFLGVCKDFSLTDFSRLSRVSRDLYLAVQEPLYSRLQIRSYGALVQLVSTLTKAPVVSRISTKQRQRWHQLSDAQLCERDIKHLDITLDGESDSQKITGAVVARCIGAVSRKCYRAKITLHLHSFWDDLMKQLQPFALPNVVRVVIFLRLSPISRSYRPSHAMDIWDLILSGSTFPDLRSAELDNVNLYPKETPPTLIEAADLGLELQQDHYHPRDHYNASSNTGGTGYYGLRYMEHIRLAFMTQLDSATLTSLFGSDIIPKNLKRLEIAFCPELEFIASLGAIAILLERALPLLDSLTLQFSQTPYFSPGSWDDPYKTALEEDPKRHLCPIIRRWGQKIQRMDLALPLACSSILLPPPSAKVKNDYSKPNPIVYYPKEYLQARLQEKKVKSRRLVIWQGLCRELHSIRELESVAATQPEDVSWELLAVNDASFYHGGGTTTLIANDVLKADWP